MTSTANSIDIARVELLLNELRLPGVKAIWSKLAAQSDKECWPAARFLAALAEHEAADHRQYGRPLRLEINAGQVHDSQMIETFLNWNKEAPAIVADKAYGSSKIRQQIAGSGLAVIPSKRNANRPIPHDPNVCDARNIVEHLDRAKPSYK
jgi:hypothetical protein